jgi:ribonuclease P protein component
MGEANLSTQEPEADAHPRLPGADVDPGGTGSDQVPPPEGSPQAHGLTWRVRDRATFRALASRPRHRRGPITLASLSCDDGAPPRVAYAVNKRVGSAVVRNRVRRRLRAAVASHRWQLHPGTAYLFGAGAEASWADLEAAVGELVGRADQT